MPRIGLEVCLRDWKRPLKCTREKPCAHHVEQAKEQDISHCPGCGGGEWYTVPGSPCRLHMTESERIRIYGTASLSD